MLTDAQLRKAQKADKPYKLSDTGGLYLYVTVEYKRLPRSFRARRSPAAFSEPPTRPARDTAIHSALGCAVTPNHKSCRQ